MFQRVNIFCESKKSNMPVFTAWDSNFPFFTSVCLGSMVFEFLIGYLMVAEDCRVDDYKILDLIGHGARSKVYLAKNERDCE